MIQKFGLFDRLCAIHRLIVGLNVPSGAGVAVCDAVNRAKDSLSTAILGMDGPDLNRELMDISFDSPSFANFVCDTFNTFVRKTGKALAITFDTVDGKQSRLILWANVYSHITAMACENWNGETFGAFYTTERWREELREFFGYSSFTKVAKMEIVEITPEMRRVCTANRTTP